MNGNGGVDLERLFNPDAEGQPADIPAWLTDGSSFAEHEKVRAETSEDQAAVHHIAEESKRQYAAHAASRAERQAREEETRAGEREDATRLAAEQAAADLARAADEAAVEAAWQLRVDAVERQDDDFRALSLWLEFHGSDIPGYDYGLDDAMFIDLCEFSEDDELNARTAQMLTGEIAKVLDEFCDLYRGMGLLRADNLGWCDCDGRPARAPRFFLVHRTGQEATSPQVLAEFAERKTPSQAVPGATIMVRVDAQPFNATVLFERAQAHGLAVGEWGQDHGTPELAPQATESREQWLARVSRPAEGIERNVARWKRSRGNLALFKAAGAAAGRVALARPIRWVIPGVLPRGYVSLLVGTKQAGKSTLLGEMLAVISSESEVRRMLLGVEVEGRGIGALVSGEDGLDFIASRNAYYELVHGPSETYAFVTAERPWREILALLEQIDDVDIIGIDPLRAVMPGNEDSSEAISQFLDELNALAQRKNCAIVLVHHLSKTSVRSLSAMLPAVRGSGAITDRPRMVIGMIDRGNGITEIGIIKHNIPPSEQLWGEVNVGRLFRRDKATLTLVPIEANSASSASPSSDRSTQDVIMTAISEQNARGLTLRRTGRSELYELRLPQLAGVSRNNVREGVAGLLAAGLLADGADGIRVVGAASILK